MTVNMPQFPESYWRKSDTLPQFPKLDRSIKTDVCIVGGGITGITAAYLLTKQNLKVVLIEAGTVLNGTTGHTTGKITAQHGLIYDELIQNFGEEQAKLYYDAQIEAKQLIENIVSEHQIDCDYQTESAYVYTNDNNYLTALQAESKAYDRLGITHNVLKKTPLNLPIKAAISLSNQAQFNPVKYITSLTNIAIKAGLEIYEQTAAISVEYNKHPTIITRNGQRIVCRHVIQASQYPFYDGQGFYPTRMYPERAYLIAIKTPQAFPGGMYINAESPTRSIRGANSQAKSAEEVWLIGGENHKTGQGKSTIEHYESLQQFALDKFDINDYLYRWSAQDYTTLDKLPYIGKVTKKQTNVYVATGFRKWGMTNGTIAAKVITDLIMEQTSPYQEIFSPSRFTADPVIKEFVKINADVAKHLIKGKLEYTNDNLDDLATDSAIITRVNGQRTGVYKDLENNLYAIDTTCTHLGCEVAWNSGERTWDCPCHGSRYSYKGEVIDGPAKENLAIVNLE